MAKVQAFPKELNVCQDSSIAINNKSQDDTNTSADDTNLPDISLVKTQIALLQPGKFAEFKCTNCDAHSSIAFRLPGQPQFAYIDGDIYLPVFKPDNVRNSKKFVPLQSDVFVAGYPKCGNTWTQNVCCQLMNIDLNATGLYARSPMIEQFGNEFVANLPNPRLFKLHHAFNKCIMNSEAKYVYIARNPKDCLISGYYHLRNFNMFEFSDGDFSVQFEYFMNGILPYGDYFDHLLSWIPHIHDKNVLFLKYEEMYADLETAVYKIGKFLGGEPAKIVEDPNGLQRVVNESKLDSMKQNQTRYFPASEMRQLTFVRKGGSRSWKKYLTREQSDRIDALFRERLAGTEASEWWKYEMTWDDETSTNMPPVDGTKTRKEIARA